ncbi:predicted protein [Plenodomus lingam JN3]|uniref:Predicted protein n=1 Tax=Leptosphaeria maculans (strain JN3 / isolate v23.1.3 / race Av1-4-5-6-7-8) TaxID=985895 RepID=E5A4U9_LEPMJ|nr:predicted protein [Plenodomus lingam JN3]CBX98647.1 predicted protein [Plenodomus lingam JN3]
MPAFQAGERCQGGGGAVEQHNEANKEDQAAYWIPQATPDGRLFYFNTLTGVSTMELPLEAPGANESGPRDRVNVFIPESSRPPAEAFASGYNVDDTDDETSASDLEGPNPKGSYSSRVSIVDHHRQGIAYPTASHQRPPWSR